MKGVRADSMVKPVERIVAAVLPPAMPMDGGLRKCGRGGRKRIRAICGCVHLAF